MIVPMKRVTVVCLGQERDAALECLRDLGAVHLAPAAARVSEDLDAARRRFEDGRAALEILAGRGGGPEGEGGAGPDPGAVMETALALTKRQKELRGRLDAIERERALQAPFGIFEPESVRALARSGIGVRLFMIPRRQEPVIPRGAHWVVLHEDSTSRYGALIGDPAVRLGGREIPLPDRSLAACERECAAVKAELGEGERRLTELAGELSGVRQRVAELGDEVAFLTARDGMGQSGALAYIQGYCPGDRGGDLKAAAAAQGWAVILRDPSETETVPTLLRNPRWIEPVKVLFRFIGVTPGYNEVDISGVFLLFYSLFFAMLVGDAGYGLLFLGLTVALRVFIRKAPPELPRLLAVLSVSTIIWGVLNGAYFGIRFESLPAPLRGVRVGWLADEQHLMSLCFLIGAVHLSVAHMWNAMRSRRAAALAQFGWVAITWALFFLAQNLIVGRPLPRGVPALFLGGLAAVVLFMTPLKSLKAEWPNHIMLPLSVIGSFGDLVSYVRLFAVGSAGAAISLAFNDMALGGGIPSVGAGLAAALILFLAHTLNILLSALAVIVHGVRLNTLEFSGHLGLRWAGVPFRPFRREAK